MNDLEKAQRIADRALLLCNHLAKRFSREKILEFMKNRPSGVALSQLEPIAEEWRRIFLGVMSKWQKTYN